MSSLIKRQALRPAWQRLMPSSPARSAAAPRSLKHPRQPLHQVGYSILVSKKAALSCKFLI